MRRLQIAVVAGFALVITHDFPSSCQATHDFTETWDELPDDDVFANAEHINRQIPFPSSGTATRELLTTFSPDNVLPVSNGGDKELLWDNGLRESGDLLLTPDDELGNYNFLDVQVETVFAAVGDLEAANLNTGVVARHIGPEDFGERKFYSAWGEVRSVDGALTIRLHLEKYFGAGFVTLDSGVAVSDAFPFSLAENFRISLDVVGPDEDGINQLTGALYRLSSDGVSLSSEVLATLEGTDRALTFGQVGLFVTAASSHTMVAYDENIVVVSPAAIPEPTCALLIVAACGALACARMRRPRLRHFSFTGERS